MAANEQDDGMEAFLENRRNRVAPNPSARNPQISKESNQADLIEEGYQYDGHKTWGFVIYRTTYDSDEDWTELIRRLRWWTTDSMEFYGGLDVLERMAWTVFDDRKQFDGADTAAVRRHFLDWAETAVLSEQQDADDNPPVAMKHAPRYSYGGSPRYRYCIQVDADALKCCVHDAPPPEDYSPANTGWVKVIDKKWITRSENPLFAGKPTNPHHYDHEPVEGSTEEHVGWLKAPLMSVMVGFYHMFRDLNGYGITYRRPPTVCE